MAVRFKNDVNVILTIGAIGAAVILAAFVSLTNPVTVQGRADMTSLCGGIFSFSLLASL